MIKIFKEEKSLKGIVQTLLAEQLYVDGWSAFYLFSDYLDGKWGPTPFTIAVHFEKGNPIAWCLKFTQYHVDKYYSTGTCWRYTKPKYRRQHIGYNLWIAIGKGRTIGDHIWD